MSTTATAATDMSITPISDALGAEVTGVDLSQGLGDGMFEAINQALLDHLVLVIRDQNLSPPQQIAFTRNWGDIVRRIATDFLHPEHPDVLVLSNRVVDGKYQGATQAYAGFTWHQDLTYAERPSMGSMLHALEVAEEGGDTAFGVWDDAVYLSSDQTWDIDDALFGVLEKPPGDVLPAESYSGASALQWPHHGA